MASRRTKAPAITLYEYEKRWIEDDSRWLVGCFSRQAGKTFSSTLKMALSMQEANSWVMLSSGERATIENMEMLQTHLTAIGTAAEAIEERYCAGDEEFLMMSIRLQNGARAIGLPANPLTARGWSMNVYLDEFAFHRDSRKIWAALFPTVTRGYRVMITSTLSGKSNKFYEILTDPTGTWTQYRIDVNEAVRQGLELIDPETGGTCTTEDLRAALGDDDAWNEEYLLLPRDGRDSWISHDLISSCEDAQAARTPSWADSLIGAATAAHGEYRRTGDAPSDFSHMVEIETEFDLYIGMDVARRRHLSVLWVDEDRRGGGDSEYARSGSRSGFSHRAGCAKVRTVCR